MDSTIALHQWFLRSRSAARYQIRGLCAYTGIAILPTHEMAVTVSRRPIGTKGLPSRTG